MFERLSSSAFTYFGEPTMIAVAGPILNETRGPYCWAHLANLLELVASGCERGRGETRKMCSTARQKMQVPNHRQRRRSCRRKYQPYPLLLLYSSQSTKTSRPTGRQTPGLSCLRSKRHRCPRQFPPPGIQGAKMMPFSITSH